MFASICMPHRAPALDAPDPEKQSTIIMLLQRTQHLEEENARLRHAATSAAALDGRDELQRENERLSAQVKEMESFLMDYGLVWVGTAGSGADGLPVEAVPEGGPGPVMDFPLLLLRLDQLNDLVGADRARVVRLPNGVHKLELPPGIPLVLYKDGFSVDQSGFRPYGERSARVFIQVGLACCPSLVPRGCWAIAHTPPPACRIFWMGTFLQSSKEHTHRACLCKCRTRRTRGTPSQALPPLRGRRLPGSALAGPDPQPQPKQTEAACETTCRGWRS